MKKTYKSKIDLWLPLFVYVVSALAFVYGTPEQEKDIAAYALFGSVLLVVTLVIFGMRYTINERKLSVTCVGIPCGSCSIDDIVCVKPTHTVLSAPAASLDRIRIVHKHGELVISPADKQEFVSALQAVNANIKNLCC